MMQDAGFQKLHNRNKRVGGGCFEKRVGGLAKKLL